MTGRCSRFALLLAAALVVGSLFSGAAHAQPTRSPIKLSHLQGQVVDSAGHPLRSAIVESADPVRPAISDDNGFFRLSGLPAGAVTITVRRTGFIATEFELRLPPDSAVFIGPEELEFRHPDKITNMLYGLNGVKLIRIKGDYLPFSTGAASMTGGMCPMAIVVDGQQVRGVAPDKFLDANDVNAIEVYNRGGNMPISMQFNDTICGVVAFWTGSRRP